MRARASPIAAFVLTVIVSNVAAHAVEPLSLDAIFAEEGHARAPSEIAWTDDGSRVAFLWSEKGERDLWTMAPATEDEPSVLVRAGELRSGEREITLKNYVWSPDGKAVLFQVAGDLYHFRIVDRALRRLTETETKNEDPRFSPDSSSVAFVRDNDLWIIDVASATARRLTTDGAEGRILNGKPDWVYWEEIWSRRSVGFWWSPDSKRIAYLRFDENGVPTYPLQRDKSIDATVEWQPYPKAGDRNPKVDVGVLDLESGATTWMKTALEEGDDYVARVRFTPKGDRLAVIRLAREQNQADLLACDPMTGECKTLLVERRDTWVQVNDDFALLSDGRVLWASDRDGWWRLYLYDAAGKMVRTVSPDGIVVSKLDRVVESTATVFFTGFRNEGLGAKDRQFYRVPIDGGAATLLSPAAAGSSAAEVAPDGRAWVLTHSTASTPPRASLFRADRRDALALPFAEATAYDRAALPRWKFITVPGPGGVQLPAAILEPPGFDPRHRYPVLMFHYGGPESQVVEDSSSERPALHLWHTRQAQRGYVVLRSDNPASAFFGKKGGERLHRRFGKLELEAQLAVVAWLKSQPWVDAARLGLWGWSGGGANTLYSVLESPGTWRAAVAGAPVTDWRLYDSIWTERYLDSPRDNEEGYRESSAIGKAERLADALLLVHGTADDNVHPQNTIMLSRELIQAGKRFEQAIYPDEKHAFTDAANRHFYQRMEEFFDRELASVSPAATNPSPGGH
jgi:dipeptidyl-peptidase-4